MDGAESFGASEAAHSDFFVLFGSGGAGGEVFGDKDSHPFGDEAGSGDEFEEFAEPASAVPGFFVEFAFGGGEWRFVRFFAAGDEFPEELTGGVAVLADHEDVAIGEDGHDHDGARVSDDVALGFDAGGFDDQVATDTEDTALVEHFGGEYARFSSLQNSPFRTERTGTTSSTENLASPHVKTPRGLPKIKCKSSCAACGKREAANILQADAKQRYGNQHDYS